MKKSLFALLILAVVVNGKEKSPTKAMLLSILPGGGQFYNEEYVRGVLFAAAQVTCVAFIVREHICAMDAKNDGRDDDYDYHLARRYDWFWWSLGVWAVSMGDAYIGAHLYNFDEDVGIKLELGYNF